MTVDRVICDLPKNGKEVLRVELTGYNGHQLVNTRVWYRNAAGDLAPSKKGMTVRADMLPRLIRALQDAERQLRAEGLITEREAA